MTRYSTFPLLFGLNLYLTENTVSITKCFLGLGAYHTQNTKQAVFVAVTITVIARVCTHMLIMVCCFSPTLTKFEFGRHILEEIPSMKVHENPYNWSWILSCGQTVTKLIVAFRICFEKAPESWCSRTECKTMCLGMPFNCVRCCWLILEIYVGL